VALLIVSAPEELQSRALSLYSPAIDDLDSAIGLRDALPSLRERGWVPKDFADVETLLHAFAVVEVNARLSLDQELALYETGSRFNHSCRPNAMHTALGTVVAVQEILAGSEITVSYLDVDALLLPTPARQAKLSTWGFRCQCSECLRPYDISRGFRCSDSECSGVVYPCHRKRGSYPEIDPMSPCQECGSSLTKENAAECLEKERELEDEFGESLYQVGDRSILDICSQIFGDRAQNGGVERALQSGLTRYHWLISSLNLVSAMHLMQLVTMEGTPCDEPMVLLNQAESYLRERILSLREHFPETLVYAEACCWEYLGDIMVCKVRQASTMSDKLPGFDIPVFTEEACECLENSWRVTAMLYGKGAPSTRSA